MNATEFWKEWAWNDPDAAIKEFDAPIPESIKKLALRFAEAHLAHRQAQQWIPVAERLPEPDTELFLFTIHGIRTGWFCRSRSVPEGEEAKPYWNICGANTEKFSYVTHWQPLPSPPKQKG